MTKTPAKFQKDLSTIVGGVVSTNYLLTEGGITELRNYGKPNNMSPVFFEKAGDKKHCIK